ncbi:hypothetical protein PtrCC142_006067 [Pyrenophora tritici-repentis]|uniref:Uncharacterized protein n=1 Tax=Pyrenophora tritici-repentis TaxID=45151 RepID=A0A834RVA6_9PLEO|nr:hypothetical protein PtrM4_105910 [Pyrenophora tritici-repentis]KAI1601356.1 hypothetical protein PtrCC142_006067 [Pyrenophora tritici-repentis]
MYFFILATMLFASTTLVTASTNNTVIKYAASTATSATTLITLVSSASPSSTTAADPSDTPAGIYVCSDIHWGGICEHKFTPLGSSDSDCTVLTGRDSSIGPDKGFFCEFYTNAYCRKFLSDESDFLGLTWPGIADLRYTAKGDFNDRVFSYACFKE